MMLVVIGRLCREDTTDLFCLKWHENALLKYFIWLHICIPDKVFVT